MTQITDTTKVITELNLKFDQLISALLDTKQPSKISLDHALWNTRDIAEYSKVTSKYASEHIVTHHTFPIAVRLPTKTASRGHPRWYAKEVINWVKKHQKE